MVKSLKVEKISPGHKKTKTVAFRLDAVTEKEFRRLAAADGIGVSTLARAVIEQYVKDYKLPARKPKKKKRA